MDAKALETAAAIVRETKDLRDTAIRAGKDLALLAYLLEMAMNEARSIVASNGGSLTPTADVMLFPLLPGSNAEPR